MNLNGGKVRWCASDVRQVLGGNDHRPCGTIMSVEPPPVAGLSISSKHIQDRVVGESVDCLQDEVSTGSGSTAPGVFEDSDGVVADDSVNASDDPGGGDGEQCEEDVEYKFSINGKRKRKLRDPQRTVGQVLLNRERERLKKAQRSAFHVRDIFSDG